MTDKPKDATSAPKKETLENKLKGKVSPEFDSEIQGLVKQRAKLGTAFQKGTADYLNTVTDEFGVVKISSDEFAKGLENAIYQAFGTARDISPDDIKALSINNEFGKDEPTSAMAYRLLFESMTGIDVEGISKRLKDMDKIEYAPVQNMVLESVKEASTAFFVDKSSKKLLAADRTSDKVAKELKALFDVAGMKVKDEQMVIPEQRAVSTSK